MSEKKMVMKLLQTALDVENKGAKIYTKLALETDSIPSKKLFQRLTDDEVVHARMVTSLLLYANQNVWDESIHEYRRLSLVVVPEFPELDIFEAAGVAALTPDTPLLEALKTAFEAEKDQYQTYKSLVDGFDNNDAKNIIRKLANEERKHALALAEEYNRLLAAKKRKN